MNQLTDAQKNALKDLAILGLVYLGAKTASAAVRYGIIGGVGYLLWRNYQSTQQGAQGMAGGWQVKVDPSMAVDMMFPKLDGPEKHFAKIAASHILNGLMPRGSGFTSR